MQWLAVLLLFVRLINGSNILLDEHSPKYQILYSNDWITDKDRILQEGSTISNNSHFTHLRKDGLDYLCNVTKSNILIDHIESSKTSPPLNSQQEKINVLKTLKNFKNEYFPDEGSCIYHIAGYWVYSFCFNSMITQFHYDEVERVKTNMIVPDPKIPQYTLGIIDHDCFDKLSDFEVLKTDDGSKYVTQVVYHGTVCDLTGRDRTTTVKYVCDPSYQTPNIINIMELQTCQYEMTIAVPTLCEDPLFKPNHDVLMGNVTCNPIRPTIDENDDMFAVDEVLKYHPKLNMHAYKLKPLGFGLYLGEAKNNVLSNGDEKPYVLITNRYIDIPEETDDDDDKEQHVVKPQHNIVLNVAKAFANIGSVGTGLMTPKKYTNEQHSRYVVGSDNYTFHVQLYGRDGEYQGNMVIEQKEDKISAYFETGKEFVRDNFVEFNGWVPRRDTAGTVFDEFPAFLEDALIY